MVDVTHVCGLQRPRTASAIPGSSSVSVSRAYTSTRTSSSRPTRRSAGRTWRTASPSWRSRTATSSPSGTTTSAMAATCTSSSHRRRSVTGTTSTQSPCSRVSGHPAPLTSCERGAAHAW